jgi:Na+/H+ antiporter NhaD/arsenite permease-like protein
MMTGLAYLQFYGFYLRKQSNLIVASTEMPPGSHEQSGFEVFDKIARAEWDTLLFFYGVIMPVGGLGFIGYPSMASGFIHGELGATTANVLVGLMSAIVDNIPVMFAVLTMKPEMPESQWLLVTLTAGVGGSLLSIGSAAGVALTGQAQGQYIFFWTLEMDTGYRPWLLRHDVCTPPDQ